LPNDDAALALSALGWILSDGPRAERFLALTGLTPDALREGLGRPETLVAIVDFLCAYEPDLLAAAEHMGIAPQRLVAVREGLDR